MAIDHFASVSELGPWLQAVAQISAAVNTVKPLGNVLNTVAETTCDLLNYEFSAVFLADAKQERLLIQGSHGLSQAYVDSLNTNKPIRIGHGPFGEGASSRAFRGHRPIVIRDYQKDPAQLPWAGVAHEQGYRSFAAIPLIVSGNAIGTLNCYTREIHDFSADEILLLETMANQAASAIEAARLREQERDTIARLEIAHSSLEAQTRILERSEEIHAELTKVVLADAGLGAIATALARIFSGSVVIDDPLGAVLASAACPDNPSIEPEVTGLADILYEDLGDLLATGQPQAVSSSNHRALSHSAFVAPVTIGKEVVARLWVLQQDGQLGALERRALEHGSTVVALELLKQRIANEVESRLRGELLDDLLDGRVTDSRALQARATHLRFDLASRHVAMVISLDPVLEAGGSGEFEAGLRRQLVGITSSTVRRLHAAALVGERDDRIVVLVGGNDGPGARPLVELADAIRREARRGLSNASVSVAIGPWVDQLADVVHSYHVARGATEISRRAGSRDRTVTLTELGVYGLLLTVGRLDELVAFSSATLGPIRAYDDRRRSELLPTLRAYLQKSCKTAEAASLLVVHPNTVAYRIRRIETLLGVDLTQPESLLRIQLALILDEIIAARETAASRPESRSTSQPRPGRSPVATHQLLAQHVGRSVRGKDYQSAPA
jgi:sugar diacid utilization regulator